MKIRLAAPVQTESFANGYGIRMVIWNQGCLCKCPGCHNPGTHDVNGGKEFDIEEIKEIIYNNKDRHVGITLSGGDPFLQPAANKELADYAHSLGLNVWAYCGQTIEAIIQNPDKLDLLKSCDILVDGPFIEQLKDLRLAFRGSSNQRIIDIKDYFNK